MLRGESCSIALGWARPAPAPAATLTRLHASTTRTATGFGRLFELSTDRRIAVQFRH